MKDKEKALKLKEEYQRKSLLKDLSKEHQQMLEEIDTQNKEHHVDGVPPPYEKTRGDK